MDTIAILLGHAGADRLPWLELPPLHPILVNFTAALVPVSFATDVLGRLTRRETLRATGWWTMCLAAAITPLTAAAGWFWLNDMPEMSHGPMPIHQWLGTTLAGLFALLAVWRWRIHRRDAYAGGAYLSVAGLLVIALVVQGHLGGLMSFGSGDAGDEQVEHPTAVPDGAPPSTTQPDIPDRHDDGGRGHEHGAAPAHDAESDRHASARAMRLRLGGATWP